jgi:hypothetical protein
LHLIPDDKSVGRSGPVHPGDAVRHQPGDVAGHWWVQWAALGIGIAWFFALFRVLRAVILAGGLAALGIYLFNRYSNAAAGPAPGPVPGTQPPDIPTVALRRE